MDFNFDNNNVASARFSRIGNGFVRLTAAGELKALTKECLLDLTINNDTSNNASFIFTDGQNNPGHPEFLPQPASRAIYLGHNQVNEDSDFLVDLLIGVHENSQSIVVNGTSTFALSGGHIAGYRIHGRLATNSGISNLQLKFSEGIARGNVKIQVL